MDLRFRVPTRIARPVEEVFDYVVEPGLLSSYFTDEASGPLVAGAKVVWTWNSSGSETVHVDELERNRKIVFRWKAAYVEAVTTVSITFEAEDAGRTLVTVEEHGWGEDAESVRSAFEHCQGWQHMLLCLRARLQYGIDLRR